MFFMNMNWICASNFQGGGWCNNVTTCLDRKNTRLGSSKQMVKQLAFSGILANKPQFNPGAIYFLICQVFIHLNYLVLNLSSVFSLSKLKYWSLFEFSDFYNWNRVKVRYCDGASFTGDVEAVDPVSLLNLIKQ